MARQFCYHMQGLTKKFGNKTILDNVHLSFYPDAKIGLIGVNGAGKSTLMKVMAGVDTEVTGEHWAAEGTKVGYLPQEPKLDMDKTVWENVIEGCEDKQIFDAYNKAALDMAEEYTDELMDQMTSLQEQVDARDAWDIDSKIEMAMQALRCPPKDSPVTSLSGGEARRVALCQLLLSKPDLLLLDEPTNHLDAETVGWLESYLVNYKGAIILITHDRYFLDNITNWTLEVDRGKTYPHEGNYSSWLGAKAKRMEQEGREGDSKTKALKRELEWIRSNPKARQTKSKARISAYEELRNSADTEVVSHAEIRIPMGNRLGNIVVEANNVSKGFGDKLLIKDLSFKLPRGGIVGVIGPNGAGKTTLFKMITGEEQPDEGTFKVGETVELGYVDQNRAALDPTKNIWEAISDGLDIIVMGKREVPSRAYVGSFNFKGTDQQKNVGQLSGGERNRVNLAKMLTKPANLLLLDEPTNDLDRETLSSLEIALEKFPGCAVVISHDRFFLDRVATHILAYEGDSHVEWFEGNFADYIEDKKRRLGPDADMPKKLKFVKFER
ncbi:energy-dependent translational throttle protein EttA [Litorimonas cladophorae]|uniref:Energy-dependent translational throttle protein EttA n=1 Tax=Litorimonas cladophorae TaxID=1220491 RepID=A0A918KAZ5_9PROT|nr:energy-dependent translational throttle protein EttA [Litorimonas cladophorae]GGX57226.1 energy-dependent translational throttle protein EttA [Litorimonas cladophorae]